MMRIHPAASSVPTLAGRPYETLKADIRRHGQKHSIALWQGQILDGRARLRACEELGLSPVIEELTSLPGNCPILYVLTVNLHRGHLTRSPLAAIGSRTYLSFEEATQNQPQPELQRCPRLLELTLELWVPNRSRREAPQARVWVDLDAHWNLVSETEVRLRLHRPWRWTGTIAIDEPGATGFVYRLGLHTVPGAKWSLHIYDPLLKDYLVQDGDALATPKSWLLASCDLPPVTAEQLAIPSSASHPAAVAPVIVLAEQRQTTRART